MTALAALALAAGAVFLRQDLPPVHIESANALTGETPVNFRIADINGDGRSDLVFDREVRFQRDGLFPENERAALPIPDTLAYMDLWKGQLFIWSAATLESYHYKNAQWEKLRSQPLPCPILDAENTPKTGLQASFQHFLHDLNGDDQPELAMPHPSGLVIYQDSPNGYTPAPPLPVYPPLRVANGHPQQLWPAEDRTLASATGRENCRVSVQGSNVQVIARDLLTEHGARFTATTYTLDPSQNYAVLPEKTQLWTSAVVPDYVQVFPRNAGMGFDLLGGQWRSAELSLVAEPLFTLYASADGGKTAHIVRSRAFRSSGAFVDFDHDGRLDLSVAETGLVDGGTRESVTRFLTQSQVKHRIRVYLRAENGRFASEPTCTGEIVIDLAQPPVFNPPLFRRYVAGELLNLTADFNGDGRNDLLVCDQPGRAAVFLAQGGTFSKQPALIAPIAPGNRIAPLDVNSDGRADLVLSTSPGHNAPESPGTVYLTRESAP